MYEEDAMMIYVNIKTDKTSAQIRISVDVIFEKPCLIQNKNKNCVVYW